MRALIPEEEFMLARRDDAGRLAGALFVISGLLTLANNYTPGSEMLNRTLLAWIGASAVALGLVVWRVVPWSRIDRRWTLTLPLLALCLVGTANAAGGVSGQTFSAFFILVAAYIGATQPQWTTAWFIPAFAAVYIAALGFRSDSTSASYWSAGVVIPVCLLVGEVLAGSLDRLRVAHARAERRAELLAVTSSAARTMSSLNPRRVLRAVADSAVNLGYDGVTVEVFDANEAVYQCVESRGLPPEFGRERHPRDDGITGEVCRLGRQVIMSGYDTDERALSELRGLGFQLVVGTPIWVHSEMGAVLNVGSKSTSAVEDSELEALELLAGLAGRALELAADFEQQGRESRRYRMESLIDPVSGLGNRRRAEQLLDAARVGDAIAMLDLDDFKRVNDTAGHDAGDRALSGMGDLLRQSLRAGDSAARYGGDEFILLVRRPGAELDQMLQRLRRQWLAMDPVTTFSAGTAIVRPGQSARVAVAQTDEALARAKASGKDCIRHAGEDRSIRLVTHAPDDARLPGA